MAKYISIGSKFKPFSYQELIAPVLMAQEQHNALEEQYGSLSSQSDTLENLLNKETEAGAYNMYKRYSDSLASSAEALTKEGLTPGSRKSLIDLKSRYAKEITPIQNAYNRRDQLSKEQRELRGKDSSMIFNQDMSQTSVDEFIKNPSLQYQGYSGNQLTQQAGQAAQALSKAIRNDPRKWNTILRGQYFETRQQKGYTTEEIIASAASDPRAPQELRDIIDQVYRGSGIEEWKNQDASMQAYNSIARGLYQSIGDVKYDMVANQDYAAALRAKAVTQESSAQPRLHFTPIARTTIDGKTDTQKNAEDIGFVQKIMSDPNLRNKKESSNIPIMTSMFTSTGSSMPYATNSNAKRMAELESKYRTKDPNKIIQELQRETEGAAIRDFQYGMNLTDNSLMAQQLQRNLLTQARNGKAPMYEYDDNSKGDRVDASEIQNITSQGNLIYDPKAGILFKTMDKDGEPKSYLLDLEVLDDPNRTLRKTMREVDKALESKEYTYANANIEMLMMQLDAKFNTQAKVQSNTDAKLDFPGYSLK